MSGTRGKAELDATVGPELAEAARKRPWEAARKRVTHPVPEEEAPAKPPAPVRCAPVTFVHTRYGAQGYGLVTSMRCFENWKLTLDVAEDIAAMRKHPDFGRVVFEEGEVPVDAQLRDDSPGEKWRRQFQPKPIRLQSNRTVVARPR